MSWDQLARDSLQSAKDLQRSGSHAHRSVVSRAYYAVYCASTCYILQKNPGVEFARGWQNPPHEQVKRLLAGFMNRTSASYQVLADFEELRGLREDADYRPGTTVDLDTETDAIQLASSILRALRT